MKLLRPPLVFGLLATMAPAQQGVPTYTRQIAPLLYQHCTGCHHPGGSGPFPLMTYAQATRWASSIDTVTQSRYMPPWLPAPGHGSFAGDRRLGDADIALIHQWVRADMPEGDPAGAPPPPVYATTWQLGPPDLILEVDSPTIVPASGADLFRNFILPYPLPQAHFIRALEIKPGTPQVVHHANLILDRSASLRRTHPKDWHDGIPGMDVAVDAGEGFDPDGHFLDWKPDSTALIEPTGMAWRLDPGNDLVLNMHLKPTGKPESVRAQIGLYFTDQAPTQLPILVQLEHDAALDIPAGDKDFVVEDQLKLPEAVDVLAIYPHAHYLGKRLEGWAELPDHTRKDLILIPSWDIDRQSIYRFAQPVPLPSGSVLHMRYSYDNSAGNPHNPNSPPIRVTSGNRSVDEMGHLWIQLLPHVSAGATQDPREPILRVWMESVLLKSPRDPVALFNLGSLDLSQHDFAHADVLFTRALEARPNDSRTMTARATALEGSGNWQSAQQQLIAAVTADPSYADAHFDLASIDLQHDLDPDAIVEFKKTLLLAPADAEAHFGLATALIAEGQLEPARPHFLQAAQLRAQNPDFLFRLATLEAQAGLVKDAIAQLNACVRLQPGRTDAHRGLASLYTLAESLPDALREQQIVVTQDTTQPDDWNNLGALLARSGSRSEAANDFRKALLLDSNNSVAQRNLQRLQKP